MLLTIMEDETKLMVKSVFNVDSVLAYRRLYRHYYKEDSGESAANDQGSCAPESRTRLKTAHLKGV